MITPMQRWRHRRKLWLFRKAYHSLDWMRKGYGMFGYELVRENIKGRHAAYRAILEMK